MPKASQRSDEVVGPARVEPGHVKNRHFRDEKTGQVSNRKAWRRLSPLELAYDKNQLAGGSSKYTASNRLAAGKDYARLWDLSQESGKDSLDMERVNSSCKGADMAETRAVAIRKLADVHTRMGDRDRQIVRMVCGEGHWPSEAVRHVCGDDYTKAVSPRFREALDALIEAFEKARQPRQVA